MKKIPIAYFYEFENCSELMYPLVFNEFKRWGADHLVLSHTLIENILSRNNFFKMLSAEMKNAGLTFMDAHSPFGIDWDLNATNRDLRKIMIAKHKAAIDLCRIFNVPTITIHIGTTQNPEKIALPYEKHLAYIKEALSELLPYAEKNNVIITIENIWFYMTSPETLWEIKKDFPTDFLGFCYDSGHANIMAQGKLLESSPAHTAWKDVGIVPPRWEEKALEKMLPEVVNCHIHDNDASFDMHTLPGEGNIYWPRIQELLWKAPRLKVIQCEAKILRNGFSIEEACKRMQKYFSGPCLEKE